MNRPLVFGLILLLFLLKCGIAVAQAPEPAPQPETIPVFTEQPSPLRISGNLEICKGAETILKAEGDFESFTWEKSGVTGRLLKVREEGVYEVTAVTKRGCRYTASVNVRVRPCS